MPRHAASDFSKTATNRLTMMVEADETTLCSYNCCADRMARNHSITDSEPDVDHRERALRALTATRSSTFSSQASSDDYTLFLADAATSTDARRRRSAAAWAELEHRASLMNMNHRTSGTDHLIPRQNRAQSAYLGVNSPYESPRPVSSRPGSSVAMSIHEYVRPTQVARAW